MATTLTLKQDVWIGGVKQLSGASVTVSESLAASLISENKAIAPSGWNNYPHNYVQGVYNSNNELVGVGDGNGTTRYIPYILSQSATAGMSVTGTVTETRIPIVPETGGSSSKSILIPANCMGVNGKLRVTTLWNTGATNANAKTVKLYLGENLAGAGGLIQLQLDLANQAGLKHIFEFQNRGTISSNVRTSSFATSFGYVSPSSTLAIDFSVNTRLFFTVTLANAGDTVTLEAYTVEVLPF